MDAQENSILNAKEKSLTGISATTATGKMDLLKSQLNEGYECDYPSIDLRNASQYISI
ncbi:hypothetical protein [Pedobacter sp.]|uniref:hypothetical protein n=1 Tax=Pedobacter sp. TaxID=1411316 RepID=UPI003D7F1B15